MKNSSYLSNHLFAPIPFTKSFLPLILFRANPTHQKEIQGSYLGYLNSLTKTHKMKPASPTKRAREVLHLIAFEHTTKEIAKQLYISYETVQTHRKNLLMKLEVKNTAGLVRRAFERRLLIVN